MDTNNNIAINEFTGGMNSDVNYSVLKLNLYSYGKNIRLTTNQDMNLSDSPDKKEGIVSAIPDEIIVHIGNQISADLILAHASIDNICVIIVKNYDAGWSVYRLTKHKSGVITDKKIFSSGYDQYNKNKFSVVINKELNGIIKLYIANGHDQIMVLNVDESFDDYNEKITTCKHLISNYYFPAQKINILNKISGHIPVGQVQYTYRFYKKYGIKSKMAPLTNKINVIDNLKSKEDGNAEGTNSSIGFQLLIWCDETCRNIFDRVLIFRLQYDKINSDANVQLIYDDAITDSDNIKYNDIGTTVLQDYTIDQFVTLDGQDIIPKAIQQNQNHMFAANIIDKTKLVLDNSFDSRAYSANPNREVILYKETDTQYKQTPLSIDIDRITTVDTQDYTLNKDSDVMSTFYNPNGCYYDNEGYLGGIGRNVSWRFVVANIPIHDEVEYSKGNPPSIKKLSSAGFNYIKLNENGVLEEENANINTDQYFQQQGISAERNIDYSDIFTSSMLRSLRRDETYRYGIVLYDINGRKSDVSWIADIKVPSTHALRLAYVQSKSDILGTKSEYVCNIQDQIITDVTRKAGRPLDGGDVYEVTKTVKSSYFNISKNNDFDISIPLTNVYIKSHICCYSITNNGKEVYNFYMDCNLQNASSAILNKLNDVNNSLNSVYKRNIPDNFTLDIDGPVKLILPSGKTYDLLNTNGYIKISDSTKQQISDYVSANGDIQNAYIQIKLIQKIYVTSSISRTLRFVIDNSFRTQIATIIEDDLSDSEIVTSLCAKSIGIEFDVHNLPDNIVGYQIVRCSKNDEFRKNLMSCVIAAPVRLRLDEKKYSPYYPHYLLSSYMYAIATKYGDKYYPLYGSGNTYLPQTELNLRIYQIYSPEITNRRIDTMQMLSSAGNLHIYGMFAPYDEQNGIEHRGVEECPIVVKNNIYSDFGEDGGFDKINHTYCQCYYDIVRLPYNSEHDSSLYNRNIKIIKDVLNPTWEEAYSNITLGGEGITSATKQYKSYTTPINQDSYLNWVCNAMYDIKAFKNDSVLHNQNSAGSAWHIMQNNEKVYDEFLELDLLAARSVLSTGFVGPGPVCFIMDCDPIGYYTINKPNSDDILNQYTTYANIQHTAINFAGLTKSEKLLDVYYGFGNFVNVKTGLQKSVVFDGEVYITPFEIVQMFKAYDFNDRLTLQSTLFVYYVPMESTINTFFDYGMNYRNTMSKNLLLEPGEITGIATQERPLSLYNPIFSDNYTSNDIYNTLSSETYINEFNHRICYSKMKINGEFIDNFTNFSALDYIDVDSRYGNITCMSSIKDVLYCWQNKSFGRINVNQRSLVKDTNSDLIQLGTGDVLQRIDYMNTRYGMSEYQYSYVNFDDRVYWIDDKNKAIVGKVGDEVVNISELYNVLNIINLYFSADQIDIAYDNKNDELLCRCLKDGDQIIFNTKLNIATSLYTRKYKNIITIDDTIYGCDEQLKLSKYNNISKNDEYVYMPIELWFVVNNNSSITKVFDNQEIVLSNMNNTAKTFQRDKTFIFNTNIDESITTCVPEITTREGNVQYSIPRLGLSEYGLRMRGKWLRVGILSNSKTNEPISHVITKFRQSF